jgi:ssDNA-binding Zn-finger/Zn-ribbon topoisomerase 1
MWTVQIIDKKYNTLIRYNVLNMNINSCLAAVKNQFELQAKNIILPDNAVKIWFCYNGDRKVTYSIKDFKFKAKGLNCPKCNWTSDLNISNGEILCPNCDTLFSV